MSAVKVLAPDQLTAFNEAIKEGRCLLVDVREEGEYEADHIHMAILKPSSQLDQWVNQLDKNAVVIVYCRTGKRSQRCAEVMISKGCREVYLLEGGFDAFNLWRRGHVAPSS
jgi:thiosulfate sulfurtransferase